MPQGLEIDYATKLNGSAPIYAEQLLLSTGHANWPSRIEDDAGDAAVNGFKRLLGRNGKFSDPFHQILITNSSLQPSTPKPSSNNPSSVSKSSVSAYMFPSFKYIPDLSLAPDTLETFTKSFLLPEKLHAAHSTLTCAEREILQRDPELQRRFPSVRDVDEVLVLICGHGSRDTRCGIMGPLLQGEFADKLRRQGVVVTDQTGDDTAANGTESRSETSSARVGLISHIGGHKFAGNVIIYIPPSMTGHALAGKGVWYGRVEPRHVEGIVAKTILGGRVIKDLFRGGIHQSGEAMRI